MLRVCTLALLVCVTVVAALSTGTLAQSVGADIAREHPNRIIVTRQDDATARITRIYTASLAPQDQAVIRQNFALAGVEAGQILPLNTDTLASDLKRPASAFVANSSDMSNPLLAGIFVPGNRFYVFLEDAGIEKTALSRADGTRLTSDGSPRTIDGSNKLLLITAGQPENGIGTLLYPPGTSAAQIQQLLTQYNLTARQLRVLDNVSISLLSTADTALLNGDAMFTDPASDFILDYAPGMAIYTVEKKARLEEITPASLKKTITAPEPVLSETPGFDCGKAYKVSELTICKTRDLAKLDRALNDVYQTALSGRSGSDKAQLVEEQRLWIVRRDKCDRGTGCLKTRMQERLAELTAGKGDGSVTADEGTPKAPEADCPVTHEYSRTGLSGCVYQAAGKGDADAVLAVVDAVLVKKPVLSWPRVGLVWNGLRAGVARNDRRFHEANLKVMQALQQSLPKLEWEYQSYNKNVAPDKHADAKERYQFWLLTFEQAGGAAGMATLTALAEGRTPETPVKPQPSPESSTVASVCAEGDAGACVAAAVQEAHASGQSLDTRVIASVVKRLIKTPFHPGECDALRSEYNALAAQIEARFGIDAVTPVDSCEAVADGVNAIAGYPVVQRECTFAAGVRGMERCYRALESAAQEKYRPALTLLTQRYSHGGEDLPALGLTRNDVLLARSEATDELKYLIKSSVALCRKSTSTSSPIKGGLIGALWRHHAFMGARYENAAGKVCLDLYQFVKSNDLMPDYHIRDWEAQILKEGGSSAPLAVQDSVRREDNLITFLKPVLKKFCDIAHENRYGGKNAVKNDFRDGKCRHQFNHNLNTGVYSALFGEWYYEWYLGRASLKNCSGSACEFLVPTLCYYSIGKLRPTCDQLSKTEFRGQVRFDVDNKVAGIEFDK